MTPACLRGDVAWPAWLASRWEGLGSRFRLTFPDESEANLPPVNGQCTTWVYLFFFFFEDLQNPLLLHTQPYDNPRVWGLARTPAPAVGSKVQGVGHGREALGRPTSKTWRRARTLTGARPP